MSPIGHLTKRFWGKGRFVAATMRKDRMAKEVWSRGGWRAPRLSFQDQEAIVANPVPAGSDVSAGTYRCTQCGNQLEVGSTQHLPPCPSCGNGQYETVSGGDSVDDPYPS
jgi:hypothetical protein